MRVLKFSTSAESISFFTKILQAIGGALSILFIVKYLGVEFQGVYYSFIGIISLQVFAEAGVGSIITQLVAHAVARNNRNPGWIGKRKIGYLLKFQLKWLVGSSAILLIFFSAFGFFYISQYVPIGIREEAYLAWYPLVFFTCLALPLNGVTSFMEGLGHLRIVYAQRLVQVALVQFTLWASFFFGAGLLALAMSVAASVVSAAAFVAFLHLRVLQPLFSNSASASSMRKLRKGINRLQLKVGASWISGYFTYNFIPPLLLAIKGPVISGQFGMTIQILVAISAIAAVPVSTRLSTISHLVGSRENEQAKKYFRPRVFLSLLVFNVGFSITLLSVVIIKIYASQYSDRILEIFPLFIIGLGFFCHHLSGLLGIFVRAHRIEPFALNSAILAFLLFITVYFSSLYGTSILISVTYFFVSLIFGLIPVYLIYRNLDARSIRNNISI